MHCSIAEDLSKTVPIVLANWFCDILEELPEGCFSTIAVLLPKQNDLLLVVHCPADLFPTELPEQNTLGQIQDEVLVISDTCTHAVDRRICKHRIQPI